MLSSLLRSDSLPGAQQTYICEKSAIVVTSRLQSARMPAAKQHLMNHETACQFLYGCAGGGQ